MRASQIIRKLLAAVVTLFVVISANFFLFRIVKTDSVASLYRGRHLTEERRAELREKFGLDGSQWDQYVAYVEQTLRGELGTSFRSGQPVLDEIRARTGPTLLLVGVSTILSAAVGIWLGILSGWKPGSRRDRAITSTTMFFYSSSDAFLGLVLVWLFTSKLPWFPTSGMSDPSSAATGLRSAIEQLHHMVLPAFVLVVGYLGQYSLIMRSSLTEVKGEDYVTLARARGLRDSAVRRRHAVPNALLPTVTLVGLNLGYVIGGAIVVETIFTWPGLGLATQEAVVGPDFPMLQGLFLVFSAAMILATLCTDLLYSRLDPRVSTP
jgi:peptide/nickel transport system permease protein